MRLMVMIVVGLALGCTVPPEQRARDVCTAYCDCIETGTSKVTACIDMCIPQIPTVSDDCLTCVYTNSQSCTTLLNDCTNLCDNQNTPLLGGMR